MSKFLLHLICPYLKKGMLVIDQVSACVAKQL